MKFVIKRTRNEQYRVLIVASNGETLFTSETYTRKAKAKKVIGVVLSEARISNYEIEDTATK